jgi:hypothetical protein
MLCCLVFSSTCIVESVVQDHSSSSSGIKLEIFLGAIAKEVGGMQHNRITKLKF